MDLRLIEKVQMQFEQQIKAKPSYGAKELPQVLKDAIIQVLSKEIEQLRKAKG